MSDIKQLQNGVPSPLPVISPIQPDTIDADKVPVKKPKIEADDQ